MNCGTCKWYRASQMPGKGNCYFNPPVVQFVPTDASMVKEQEKSSANLALPERESRLRKQETAGMIAFMPLSARPFVQENHFCHEYAKAETTKH